MAAQAVISWGDPVNYCTVSRVELCGEELLLVLCTEGREYAAEDAEVTTPASRSNPPFQLCGRKHVAARRPCENRNGQTEVTLAFDCPAALQCAEDVLFSYAPGYSCVSILDLILTSLVKPHPLPGPDEDISDYLQQARAGRVASQVAEWPPRPSEPVAPWTVNSSPSQARREAWPMSEPNVPPGDAHQERPLRTLQPQQQTTEPPARDPPRKRESTPPSAMTVLFGQAAPRRSSSTPKPGAASASSASCEAFFSAVEAGNARTAPVLERRLAELGRLRKAWEAGDGKGLADALEGCRDDALLYGAMERLELRAKPWRPKELARLLPLAQHLSSSREEEHAVVAMLFAMKALETSWPAVVRAMQNVATPKAAHDDCKLAVQSVSAFFQMVKTLSRSVRITRTNGPLVPVCRELKNSLEKALRAVGRTRGSF